jgi:hypothetical protein
MQKRNVLDDFMEERRARLMDRPAARFVVELGIKASNGARANVRPAEVVGPPPETKREEPTQMHYKPAPSANGPGMSVPRPVPVRPSAPQVAQGIAVQAAMNKIDPLDRFMAEHRAKAAKVARPSEKLVMGQTNGMSM